MTKFYGRNSVHGYIVTPDAPFHDSTLHASTWRSHSSLLVINDQVRRKRNRGTLSAFDRDQRRIAARKSGSGMERSNHHRLRWERLDFRRAARSEVHPPGRRYRHDL